MIESEIWPHLILEAERVRLPLALINGRMSARSAARWHWADSLARRLLGSFALCLARSQADADRLSDLGALDVQRLGDLKHATPPLPAAPAALVELKADIGARPGLACRKHPSGRRGGKSWRRIGRFGKNTLTCSP